MKFAICYSGHLRTLLELIDNHKKNILDINDCDIYLNLWDNWGNGSYKTEITRNEKDLIDYKTIDKLINKLQPKFYEFQNFDQIKHEFDILYDLQKTRPNPNMIMNVISMFYKIERGYYHVEKSKKTYDGFIRIRPDIYFYDKIKLFLPEKNTLYTSLEPRWNLSNFGLNDIFGFGDMETMKNYCTTYSNLYKIFNDDIHLNCAPEALLKLNIESTDIKIKDILSYGEFVKPLHTILRNNNFLE